MKVTWNMALASLVVLGCIVTWSFAQQLTPPPPVSGPPDAGRFPAAALPAVDAYPARVPSFAGQPPAAQGEEMQTIVEVTPDGRVMRTYRANSAGRHGGTFGFAYAGMVSDPDAARLFAAEEEAAKEAHALTGKLKSITDEKEKADATTKLREALARQFDAQQKRRALEIGKIEERLAKLKDTMKKRETAKETIVGRRLDELTGMTDDLGWEETGGPARVRSVEPNYGLPAQVPTAPRGFPGGEDSRRPR